MTDLERTIIREELRILLADRDTLYRMINAVNAKCKELDEILEFDKLTKNK